MYNSLRDFIDLLEKEGELIRITEFTDPYLEIAEITDRVSKSHDGGKALLFENTGTTFPVLTNMMGSPTRICHALGTNSLDYAGKQIESLFNEMTKERNSFLDKLKILPYLKDASKWLPVRQRGDAPCQEVIQFNPDINKLPVLKCWPGDGGRFITLPLVHTNDPENGSRNVGMYRMQLFSPTTTGMHWHRHKTGARHFSSSKESRFPIAVALGGDPVYTYAATAPLPDGIDEYLLAGFLRDRPVSLVECLTQPIKVPADCDIIIEGYINKNDPLIIEGPFGDHTGFYSPKDLYPKMTITCISHRKNAIYPATLVGIPPQEDKYIAEATEKIFLTPIKLTMAPEILDLHLPEEGVGHNLAYVKISKSYPGHAIKVAHALWGAGQMMFNKIMIITDREIELRDHKKVLKAIAENYIPERDTHFSRGPLDILDHSAPACGYGGKIMIDATKKLPEEISKEEVTDKPPIHFTKEIGDYKGLINILTDLSLDDDYYRLWIWGNNCDPVRDSFFTNGMLVMDARHKEEAPGIREWPDIATSDKETIDLVDKKWKKLGLGEFIESPSLKFKQ